MLGTSSGTSRVALPDLIGYTMTKGAIDALTLPLARRLGPRGITVNTVVPATTDTDMNTSWLRGNSELIAAIAAQNATGGFRL
ncbi:SDR family oxidoreductase [Streptomyces phaeochromogenes]